MSKISILKLDLSLPAEYEKSIQRQCQDIFFKTSGIVLDSLLSCQTTGRIIIPLLELDLGDIAFHDFEHQFGERLLTQLSLKLAEFTAGLFISDGNDDVVLNDTEQNLLKQAVTITTPPGVASSDDSFSPITEDNNPVEILCHSLKNGYLREHDVLAVSQWRQSGASHWLINHLIPYMNFQHTGILIALCLKKPLRQRLQQTFSPDAIRHLCCQLVGDNLEFETTSSPSEQELNLILAALLAASRHQVEAHLPSPEQITVNTSWNRQFLPWLTELFSSKSFCSPAKLGWLSSLWHAADTASLLGELLPQDQWKHIYDRLEFPTISKSVSAELSTVHDKKMADSIDSLDLFEDHTSNSAVNTKDTVVPMSVRSDSLVARNKETEDRIATSADSLDLSEDHTSDSTVNTVGVINNRANSNQENDPDMLLKTETIMVPNAGIVLLWPLLPSLLRKLSWLKESTPSFIDKQACHQAVCWLDLLLWQDDQVAEWRTPLLKIFCGLPVNETLSFSATIEPIKTDLMNQCLAETAALIPSCQPQDLRTLFLQRPGKLQLISGGWQLRVESSLADILLTQLPWSVEQIQLPWMGESLSVMWPFNWTNSLDI